VDADGVEHLSVTEIQPTALKARLPSNGDGEKGIFLATFEAPRSVDQDLVAPWFAAITGSASAAESLAQWTAARQPTSQGFVFERVTLEDIQSPPNLFSSLVGRYAFRTAALQQLIPTDAGVSLLVRPVHVVASMGMCVLIWRPPYLFPREDAPPIEALEALDAVDGPGLPAHFVESNAEQVLREHRATTNGLDLAEHHFAYLMQALKSTASDVATALEHWEGAFVSHASDVARTAGTASEQAEYALSQQTQLARLSAVSSELRRVHRSAETPFSHEPLQWFASVNDATGKIQDELRDSDTLLREVREDLRNSLALVAATAATRQLELQQLQQEGNATFQRVVTVLGAAVLVPGLIATMFGANTGLPGRDEWIGTGIMLGLMAISAASVLMLLNWLESISGPRGSARARIRAYFRDVWNPPDED
jgi:hypothetical protein